MKKMLCVLLTLSLLICAAALAAEYNEDDKTASTTLTTTIADSSQPTPTYTIIIPSTLEITPNATNTQMNIQVMDVENVTKIDVTTAASGSMASTTGGSIAFTVTGNELSFSNFSNLSSSKTMIINITAEEWQQAAAGDYTGTMSFTISAE